MNYYLIITALTVSIDSFLCGLSLSMGTKKSFPIILIITLTVFTMCLLTNYSTFLFDQYLTEKTANLGGIILIAIGLFNLFKKDDASEITKGHLFTQILSVGFAVGLDGAFANLSLSIMGINAFYVPLTIALTHGGMIALSIALSKTSIAKKICKLTFIAPLILIGLGLHKVLCFFI